MPKKAMSKEQLVRSFEENLLAREEWMGQGNIRKANKYADKVQNAWEQLCALGDEGREALVLLLDHPHPQVRLWAAQSLLGYRTEKALEVLQQLAHDRRFYGRSFSELVIETWQKHMAEEQESSATPAPTPTELPSGREELVQFYEEHMLACGEWVKQGDYQTANTYAANAQRAWEQLRALGDEGREALVPLLDHPHPLIRLAVAQCLLRYRTEKALKVLKQLARDRQFSETMVAQIVIKDWQKRVAKGQDSSYPLDPVDTDTPAPAPHEQPSPHRDSEHAREEQPTTLSREALMEMLQEAGLAAEAPHLVERARPSIRIRTRPAGKGALPCGASKFGGSPDLPPGFA
ncbi:MAG: HEAT repeat domain-containing protein [Armatimonadota bacterium]